MTRRIPLAATLILLPLALAACGSSLSDNTMAKVGDMEIPAPEIQRVIDQQRTQAERSGTDFAEPGSEEELEFTRNLLDQAIAQRITAIEAKACGKECTATEKEIAQRRDEIIRENFKGKKADFEKFTRESGLSDQAVRQIIQFEIEDQKRATREGKGIRFTRAEAIKYCRDNPAQFKQPERRSASHILVRNKDLADQIADEATAANFSELAAKYSIDPGSRSKGGDLGTLERGQMVAPFEREAFRLANGEISRPVKTQFGWHVIRVTVTPARDIPCAEAADDIRAQQLAVKRQEAMDAWRKKMREKYADQIVYADDKLKKQEQPPVPGINPAAPQGSPSPPAQPEP